MLTQMFGIWILGLSKNSRIVELAPFFPFFSIKLSWYDFMYLENPDDVVLRNLLIRNMPLFKDDSLIERNDRERQSRK